MRIAERIDWDGADAPALAARLRASVAAPAELREQVAEIVAGVRRRGDGALRELTARFDATESLPETLVVPAPSLAAARDELEPELRDALELAAANIRGFAEAQLGRPAKLTLAAGQTLRAADHPVASAAVYAPGGRAAYPSSVLMGVIPARVAGVARVVVATPPAPDGTVDPVVLAAAAIAGADELLAAGGAQAIAALALGTETVAPVDVIAGPGNAWVTEAKRQLYGTVGIDGLAGPSELVVIADSGAELEAVALDLLAQAEHGPDSPLVAIATDGDLLDRLATLTAELGAGRASVTDAPLTLVRTPDVEAALRLSDAFAPEHLELCLSEATAELAAERVAGCVFIGTGGATAFGDYVAGSNHVLPTAGAARFSGPLGPRAFMRRTSVVEISAEAAGELAAAADAIARAEGLPVHGESARRRAGSGPEAENQ